MIKDALKRKFISFFKRITLREALKIGFEGGSYILQFGCAVHLINKHFFEINECTGPSMLPTLAIEGDFLAQDKISPKLGLLSVGDLIVFSSPANPHTTACKRIIGMPGDIVCIDPTLDEEFREYIKVPKGKVWVMGDNSTNSTDSRFYGPVPLGLVMSKVIFRIYPNFFSFGKFSLNSLENNNNNLSNIINSDDLIKQIDYDYLLGQ